MKQRKALITVVSGLGVVAVTALAIGFDLAVVGAGHPPDRPRSAPTGTAAATPAREWVQLRMPGPGGVHRFTIKLHHSHVHLGIG